MHQHDVGEAVRRLLQTLEHRVLPARPAGHDGRAACRSATAARAPRPAPRAEPRRPRAPRRAPRRGHGRRAAAGAARRGRETPWGARRPCARRVPRRRGWPVPASDGGQTSLCGPWAVKPARAGGSAPRAMARAARTAVNSPVDPEPRGRLVGRPRVPLPSTVPRAHESPDPSLRLPARDRRARSCSCCWPFPPAPSSSPCTARRPPAGSCTAPRGSARCSPSSR